MSRSQLWEQICQTSKSDRQEWQSLVVLNGANIFLNGTNISFLKFICEIVNRGVANSFWNHVIQISNRQMYFQDIYSNLWKVKVFNGNIYSLKPNTHFWGTVMFVQDGFLYLIVTRHKLTVNRKNMSKSFRIKSHAFFTIGWSTWCFPSGHKQAFNPDLIPPYGPLAVTELTPLGNSPPPTLLEDPLREYLWSLLVEVWVTGRRAG